MSFTRMETGKASSQSHYMCPKMANSVQFAQSRTPFDLHKSLQMVAQPYRTQARLAGLNLNLYLDDNIDNLRGSLVGDELRLRQITTFVLLSPRKAYLRTGTSSPMQSSSRSRDQSASLPGFSPCAPTLLVLFH